MNFFFTFNDFTKDDGGTIRMRGIVNALAKSGQRVILLSNAESHDGFYPQVEHILLQIKISKKEKRIFQLLLSCLPTVLTKQIFKIYAKRCEEVLKNGKLQNQTIIFFEHLDNSMGYFLKEHKIIEDYINDTHGIAYLEFLHKHSDNFIDTVINKFKSVVALKLDRKIINAARGMIFVSETMKEYFKIQFPILENKENYVVHDGVNSSLCKQKVDLVKVETYKKCYSIKESDKVIFFAGLFKDLGGVIDLIKAFSILVEKNTIKHLKLLLLGDGECYEDAKNMVKIYKLEDKVIFLGRKSYTELKNYQELSTVIVCPDKKHPYSELVPHIKYFDSLASGKIVINGSFASVKEINQNERFSINFEPSNISDLAEKIEMVLLNKESLAIKYKENKNVICSEFTYSQSVKVLLG